MNHQTDSTRFLRISLRSNAAFSCLSGFVFSLAYIPIASFIGLQIPWIVLVTGLSLILFAIGLYLSSVRETPNLLEAKIAVALDLGWVLASAVIISLGLLSRSGNWMLVAIADIVLVMAVLQFVGLRRLRGMGQELAGEK